MRRDPTEFRERFKAYKEGKMPYENGLPKYIGGKDPYEDFVDAVIKEEGFLSKPKDIGDGKTTIGSGLTAQKWIDQYNKKGVWSAADNRTAVKEELNNTAKYLRQLFPNYDQLPESAKHVLMDIGYNVGSGTLSASKSPKFVKAVRSGNWLEAMNQMDWGNNQVDSQGRPFRGLRERNKRRQEAWAQAFGLRGRYNIPEQEIKQYTSVPDAVAVNQIIPQEQTRARWTGAESTSPYITGKPMIKLQPRIQLPNIIDLVEDSQWSPEYDIPQIVLPQYKNGKSPIHINPANRGKFNATKKRTGKTTEQLTHSSNPLTRKRAIFALNARKWHH